MSALTDFKNDWINCRRCTLCSGGYSISDGPETARIIIIGEASGATEVEKKLPFVGPAGKLLTKILEDNGIKRNEIYFTNSVRGWPKLNGKTIKPSEQQLNSCRPLLIKEIELIQPRFILTVGAVAAQQLLNHRASLGSVVGQWFRYNNIPALVTYHPAAYLHVKDIDAAKGKMYIDTINRDITALAKAYREPIATVVVKDTSNKTAYLPF